MAGFSSEGLDHGTEQRETNSPASSPAHARAAEVARYLADMTAQLELMANSAQLDLLAYFLAMARSEAEQQARTPSADAGTLSRDRLRRRP
jgi:hypothetical protein